MSFGLPTSPSSFHTIHMIRFTYGSIIKTPHPILINKLLDKIVFFSNSAPTPKIIYYAKIFTYIIFLTIKFERPISKSRHLLFHNT